MSKKLKIDEIGTEEIIKIEQLVKALSSSESGVFPEDELKKLKEFTSFREMLTKESDRGCALMSASYIDVKLEEFLKKSLVDNKKARDSVFDNNGPLGTFSGKINMAFLLGIIPKNIFDDLHILRKIRNDFAHNPAPLTFDEPSISSRCYSLKVHNLTNKEKPRSVFSRNMTSILTFFNMKENQIERPDVYPDFDIDNITDIINTVITDMKKNEKDKKKKIDKENKISKKKLKKKKIKKFKK